jgi:hypothetical protein
VFGKPGYQYLLYFTLLYKHGSELEQSPYASEGGLATGTPADFLYMLLFGAGVLLVTACGFAGLRVVDSLTFFLLADCYACCS